MNEALLDKLEFGRVRQRLSTFCACGLGRELALSLKPTAQADTVRHWLDQARELADAAERLGPPPMGGMHDIRAAVRATALPTPLEAAQLNDIAETLEATANLRAWLERTGDDLPALASQRRRVADLSPVAARIRACIDARGQVVDHASPRLRAIRAAIDEAHDRINVVFDRILRHTSVTRLLQFHGTTYHNDRVVLPLKAEQRGRIPGIIHRSSDSGATLFVEPSEVVELNNTIIELRGEEHREVSRILGELCRAVHKESAAILDTLRAVAVLDLNRAKWAYAKHYQCTIPAVDEGGRMELHDARHPVLMDIFETEAVRAGAAVRQVVPIDVRLGEDFDALVITGPNTGGKTVALKTVGLLALMTQCGLPIPAGEGSRLPVYRRIFVDIGDEQSIQQSLSTFSSHISNLLSIVQHSGPGTLALIDELGAGTDPDEGAAIGRAIVEELLSRGASVMVTTHLSALKALAFTRPRVDNASVEFDVQTLRPMYRLRLGEPGQSNALTIAARLGMSARLVEAARRHLAGRQSALDAAIAGTLKSRREAEEARKTAREAEVQTRRAREDYEARRLELQHQREEHQRWTQWVAALRPGDDVYVRSARSAGRVIRMALQKQTALVAVGAFEMEVPLAEVQTVGDEAG